MKNFKKISRQQLKSVKGGATPVVQCKIGFHECSCECVANKK
ncbi:bacteriocin-like protein [Chryseobacterium sp. 'Rf worker isolate 10']